MKIASGKAKAIILSELRNKFGSIETAKRKAKALSLRYKNHLIEYKRRFGHLKRQTARANNFFSKVREADCYLKINETDTLFYTYNVHFANANGKGGSGYYVRMKTSSGVLNIKI